MTGRRVHVGIQAVIRAARVDRVMEPALAIGPVAGFGLVARADRDAREQPQAQDRRDDATRVRASVQLQSIYKRQ